MSEKSQFSPTDPKYTEFHSKVHSKILLHKTLSQIFSTLSTELISLSSPEISILKKNQYWKLYTEVQPLLDKQVSPEARQLGIGEALHRRCTNEFDNYVECLWKKGKLGQKECQPQITAYVGCLEKVSKGLVMSTLRVY